MMAWRGCWFVRWLVLLLLLVVAMAVVAAAPRREIDYEALEKAWEAGDAPQEVRSHADDQYDRLSAMPTPQAKAMGPQMVFVTLNTLEPLTELAGRWKEMLWNGGVDVNIYEIETSKVLVGLQKGMFMRELRLFLHEQREVVAYDWNSKTYARDDPIDAEVVESASLSKKTKKKKTKGKAKKTHTAHHSKATHDGL